jgi:hypothetical protein
MPSVGDRVRVASTKVGQVVRIGVVTGVVGRLLRIRWSTGEESSVIPGPGSVTVVGKAKRHRERRSRPRPPRHRRRRPPSRPPRSGEEGGQEDHQVSDEAEEDGQQVQSVATESTPRPTSPPLARS